jgi:hypothetical protein
VNFRTERLQHEFVSTTLTLEERRRFRVIDAEWVELSPASQQLKLRIIDLLKDWGGFLDINLYREALVHFLGGPEVVSRSIEIFSGSNPIGIQNFNMLDTDTAFALTMKQRDTNFMRNHLERLLCHTSLKAIQWINLNRHVAEFVTLRSLGKTNVKESHAQTESLRAPRETVAEAWQ